MEVQTKSGTLHQYQREVKILGNFEFDGSLVDADPETKLTESEKAQICKQALIKAEQVKQSMVKNAQYKAEITKPKPSRNYTADEYLNLAVEQGKKLIEGFVLDKENEKIYKLLSQYFAKDPEFEKDGLLLKKGLMLFGPIGCGKTVALDLFKVNQRASYNIVSCREMAHRYQSEGAEVIRSYGQALTEGPVYGRLIFTQTEFGVCFDDLGTEKEAKHFGSEANVMQEVLQERYLSNTPKHYTHVTTNLTAEQIEEYYGPRVRSRMRDMFNLISFPTDSKDRRK